MARGYIFTNKKHSVFGMMSTVFGLLSFVTYILCIRSSYITAGVSSQRLGTAAFFATVFLVTGSVLGMIAIQEEDSFKLFKITGIVINVFALLALSAILYAGALFVD